MDGKRGFWDLYTTDSAKKNVLRQRMSSLLQKPKTIICHQKKSIKNLWIIDMDLLFTSSWLNFAYRSMTISATSDKL